MLSASDLHARGLEESNAGRHTRARQLFRKALDRADEPDVRAGVLLSLAHVEAERGSVDDGLALCAEALEQPGLSAELVGRITAQVGLLRMRAGDGDAALGAFEEALPLVDAGGLDAARIHLNRGNVHLQRGAGPAAVTDFAEAARVFHLHGATVEAAKVEHNLGYAYLLAGDLPSALQQMDRARAVLAGLSPVYAAVCEQDRAEVLLAAGLTNDAAEALRAAARALGARGLRQRQGEAEYALAQLLLLVDRNEARSVARRARTRFRRRGSDAWAARSDAVAYRAGTPVGDSRDLVVELETHGLHRDAELVTLHQARQALAQGEPEEAGRLLGTVRLARTTPLTSRLVHHEVKAEVARARNRRSDALDHVRRGLAELHDWQSSFGSLDLQSSLVVHGRRLALQGVGMALDDGRPHVVFEWSERARALATRVTPVRPPSDDEAAGELAELRRLQAELAREDQGGRGVATRQRRASELRRRIRERQWYGAGSGVVVEPASLDEAIAGLQHTDDALVAYLAIDDRLVALTVAGPTSAVHELGSLDPVRQLLSGMQADLDMSAARLPATLRQAVQDGLRARLDDLAVKLVQPVLPEIGDRRVVVVPAGALAGVPWTLLPGLFGRPLSVPRSATTWLATHGWWARPARAGFVAGPRVERAVEEVQSAAKAWTDARVLQDADAAARHVGALANDVDVFHVAAHGRHSADSPLFSGLELVDGPWFGYDVDLIEQVPATVILSACELGRSSVRWGDETIGMTVAWLHAGAQTVIASPASVDDDVACFTLAATHHYLATGAAPAEALADAMVEVGGPVPAPFACFGSGW